MVVDALMQIPWLVAIVNAVVWVGKTVWDLIGKTWRMVAAWFATYVPLVLRWARENIAHRLIVVGLWLTLVTACWTGLTRLVANFAVASFPSGLRLGPFVDFFWSDPMNFSTAWSYLSTLWGIHISAMSLRVLWLKFHWAAMSGATRL